MAMMAMIQIHEYATGWRSDHGSPGRAGALGLPNSFLSASATVVIGFHEAMVPGTQQHPVAQFRFPALIPRNDVMGLARRWRYFAMREGAALVPSHERGA